MVQLIGLLLALSVVFQSVGDLLQQIAYVLSLVDGLEQLIAHLVS